eukprot:Blabericola_migrator_1__9956@NODE_5502_length_746_cov_880_273932_g3248_i1_p1_GENE_NODE_5502_length_746_cov_880_273932_g3248_i1NODE_5502_length_746_cov_880_273932_g3248_i1_p1_ORF_typecomplete_len183_score50_91Histone/PF00125_24/0_00012Histone/PF00125_24/6_1e03CBFD_NFYB_HMF/PF00808_23/0_0041Clp_N/PF02861_20/2_1e03Clp_N/PF02861_20/0_18_NODE_5502_length_746_cov_880_273932_g3248_i1122670
MAKTASKKTPVAQKTAAKKVPTKAPTSEAKATKVMAAQRAGLIFQPSKFQRLLRKGGHTQRVSAQCGIYMAGALEWLVGELLDCMMDSAEKSKNSMLHPRHVMAAIVNDEEFSTVFNKVVIIKGGMGRTTCVSSKAPKKAPKKVEAGEGDMNDGDEEPEEEEEEDAASEAGEEGDHNDSQEY